MFVSVVGKKNETPKSKSSGKKETKEKGKGTVPVCASCGLEGHRRRSHKMCPMNKANLENKNSMYNPMTSFRCDM